MQGIIALHPDQWLQRFYAERKGSRRSGEKTNQAGSGREGLARSETVLPQARNNPEEHASPI